MNKTFTKGFVAMAIGVMALVVMMLVGLMSTNNKTYALTAIESFNISFDPSKFGMAEVGESTYRTSEELNYLSGLGEGKHFTIDTTKTSWCTSISNAEDEEFALLTDTRDFVVGDTYSLRLFIKADEGYQLDLTRANCVFDGDTPVEFATADGGVYLTYNFMLDYIDSFNLHIDESLLPKPVKYTSIYRDTTPFETIGGDKFDVDIATLKWNQNQSPASYGLLSSTGTEFNPDQDYYIDAKLTAKNDWKFNSAFISQYIGCASGFNEVEIRDNGATCKIRYYVGTTEPNLIDSINITTDGYKFNNVIGSPYIQSISQYMNTSSSKYVVKSDTQWVNAEGVFEADKEYALQMVLSIYAGYSVRHLTAEDVLVDGIHPTQYITNYNDDKNKVLIFVELPELVDTTLKSFDINLLPTEFAVPTAEDLVSEYVFSQALSDKFADIGLITSSPRWEQSNGLTMPLYFYSNSPYSLSVAFTFESEAQLNALYADNYKLNGRSPDKFTTANNAWRLVWYFATTSEGEREAIETLDFVLDEEAFPLVQVGESLDRNSSLLSSMVQAENLTYIISYWVSEDYEFEANFVSGTLARENITYFLGIQMECDGGYYFDPNYLSQYTLNEQPAIGYKFTNGTYNRQIELIFKYGMEKPEVIEAYNISININVLVSPRAGESTYRYEGSFTEIVEDTCPDVTCISVSWYYPEFNEEVYFYTNGIFPNNADVWLMIRVVSEAKIFDKSNIDSYTYHNQAPVRVVNEEDFKQVAFYYFVGNTGQGDEEYDAKFITDFDIVVDEALFPRAVIGQTANRDIGVLNEAISNIWTSSEVVFQDLNNYLWGSYKDSYVMKYNSDSVFGERVYLLRIELKSNSGGYFSAENMYNYKFNGQKPFLAKISTPVSRSILLYYEYGYEIVDNRVAIEGFNIKIGAEDFAVPTLNGTTFRDLTPIADRLVGKNVTISVTSSSNGWETDCGQIETVNKYGVFGSLNLPIYLKLELKASDGYKFDMDTINNITLNGASPVRAVQPTPGSSSVRLYYLYDGVAKDYVAPQEPENPKEPKDENEFPIMYVAIGAGVLVVLIAVILLVINIRKKSRK